MNKHTEKILYNLLIALEKPIKQQQSGTFYIATADNRSFRVAFKSGRMTHCTYGRLHGHEAVTAIDPIICGRSNFFENQPSPFKERDQISHEVLLKQFSDLFPKGAALLACPSEQQRSLERSNLIRNERS